MFSFSPWLVILSSIMKLFILIYIYSYLHMQRLCHVISKTGNKICFRLRLSFSTCFSWSVPSMALIVTTSDMGPPRESIPKCPATFVCFINLEIYNSWNRGKTKTNKQKINKKSKQTQHNKTSKSKSRNHYYNTTLLNSKKSPETSVHFCPRQWVGEVIRKSVGSRQPALIWMDFSEA